MGIFLLRHAQMFDVPVAGARARINEGPDGKALTRFGRRERMDAPFSGIESV